MTWASDKQDIFIVLISQSFQVNARPTNKTMHTENKKVCLGWPATMSICIPQILQMNRHGNGNNGEMCSALKTRLKVNVKGTNLRPATASFLFSLKFCF